MPVNHNPCFAITPATCPFQKRFTYPRPVALMHRTKTRLVQEFTRLSRWIQPSMYEENISLHMPSRTCADKLQEFLTNCVSSDIRKVYQAPCGAAQRPCPIIARRIIIFIPFWVERRFPVGRIGPCSSGVVKGDILRAFPKYEVSERHKVIKTRGQGDKMVPGELTHFG
jgi:hypothetical protein